MVSYSKMTDAEIEKYREKSRKEAEKNTRRMGKGTS